MTDPVNNRICRYSLNGENPLYFGTTGHEDGEFDQPHWLAFDPDRGRLYVTDNSNTARVQVFDGDGTYLFTIGDTSLSSAPGSFSGNVDCIALDAAGNLFVGERNTVDGTFWDRIQVFGPDGSFQRVFAQVVTIPPSPTAGQWRELEDIDITADGEVFLLDVGVPGYEDRRVHHLDIDGTPLGIWGENGNGPGQFDYPFNLASDDGEFVWVSCNTRLLKFRRNGEFVIEMVGAVDRNFGGIDIHPGAPSIMYAGSFGVSTDPERIEVFATPIPAYNILDSHWLEDDFHLISNDPALLIDCDGLNVPIDGVAADGVSPVLLSYEFAEPYSVTWSLTDLNPGSVPGNIGELASIDGTQQGSSIDVTTEDIGGRHVAFAVYTAPLDFDRAGCPEDLPLESRGVRVHMDYEPVGGGPSGYFLRNLDIVRPPVVFVHGLWSNPGTWDDFATIRDDSRWDDSDVDYKDSHGSAFAENSYKVLDEIVLTKTRSRTFDRIATAQVDLVVHSMGGCLARKLASTQEYKRGDNLGEGDFHKLLTLNTPHAGSPVASAMVSIRESSQRSLSAYLFLRSLVLCQPTILGLHRAA